MNEIKNERVSNLLKLGVDFNKVSLGIGLTVESTIKFLTEDYQYERIIKTIKL